jgi:outer membrane biosynthesis protein TonB
MSARKGNLLSMAACAASASLLAFSAPAMADNSGAFIGGMVTMKVMNNMERRTQAEEAQASRPAPQPVQHAPAQPARPSKETQLQDLDRLAAGGYITPQEYKDRRKAILDSM